MAEANPKQTDWSPWNSMKSGIKAAADAITPSMGPDKKGYEEEGKIGQGIKKGVNTKDAEALRKIFGE
jgi:hypothetical protein